MLRTLFTVLFLGITLFHSSLNAADSAENELKDVMVEKADNLYTILRDKSLETPVRQQKVLDEVSPLFDFDLMARLALDTKTWKTLTPTQQSEFSKLFISRIQNSYLSKLDLFADTEVEVKESVRVKKNRIQVVTLLKSSKEAKEIVYKFYQTREKKWLIYDVDVVGVSFLQSYRSQFASFLQEHSFNDLLLELQKDEQEEPKKVAS